MMEHDQGLLLAYYGDDFTGSTDALEFLTRAGIKTVLFIEPPTQEQLSKYPDIRAIGVAGMTRSMPPGEMEKVLYPAFEALKLSGAPHVHYKVCSTFDSSPFIGSIGKAIDVGAEIFRREFVPLLVAAPALGRHCVFGNLFARMGIGSKGLIHRLDRHPSMSRHPVTPADESDLTIHLSKQTQKKIDIINILEIVHPPAKVHELIRQKVEEGSEIILFDGLYQEQMAGIGEVIDAYAAEKPLFSVGSSGIEMALGGFWANKGIVKATQKWDDPDVVGPLLVASGSCSPVTSSQIEWAMKNGFAEIALDTAAIAENEHDSSSLFERYIENTVALIEEGKSVILHTSKGGDDERVNSTDKILKKKGLDESAIRALTARIYGTALGRIVRSVAGKVLLKRIVIAGGDTSSIVARELGIEAVEMIAPLSPGAPLCKAHAPGSPIDDLEVNFKGGQVGREDYFGMVRKGKCEI